MAGGLLKTKRFGDEYTLPEEAFDSHDKFLEAVDEAKKNGSFVDLIDQTEGGAGAKPDQHLTLQDGSYTDLSEKTPAERQAAIELAKDRGVLASAAYSGEVDPTVKAARDAWANTSTLDKVKSTVRSGINRLGMDGGEDPKRKSLTDLEMSLQKDEIPYLKLKDGRIMTRPDDMSDEKWAEKKKEHAQDWSFESGKRETTGTGQDTSSILNQAGKMFLRATPAAKGATPKVAVAPEDQGTMEDTLAASKGRAAAAPMDTSSIVNDPSSQPGGVANSGIDLGDPLRNKAAESLLLDPQASLGFGVKALNLLRSPEAQPTVDLAKDIAGKGIRGAVGAVPDLFGTGQQGPPAAPQGAPPSASQAPTADPAQGPAFRPGLMQPGQGGGMSASTRVSGSRGPGQAALTPDDFGKKLAEMDKIQSMAHAKSAEIEQRGYENQRDNQFRAQQQFLADTAQAQLVEQKSKMFRDEQMQAIAKTQSEILSPARVDPDRFWNSRGTSQKIAGVLAAFFSGGDSIASIHAAINRDVAAQQADISNTRNYLQDKLGAQMNTYHMGRQNGLDDTQAVLTARATTWQQAMEMGKSIEMSTKSELVKQQAQILQVEGQKEMMKMNDLHQHQLDIKDIENRKLAMQKYEIDSKAAMHMAAARALGKVPPGAEMRLSAAINGQASVDQILKIVGKEDGYFGGTWDEVAKADPKSQSSRKNEKIKAIRNQLIFSIDNTFRKGVAESYKGSLGGTGWDNLNQESLNGLRDAFREREKIERELIANGGRGEMSAAQNDGDGHDSEGAGDRDALGGEVQ